jgi:phage tail sheath protein FI
VFEPNGTPLWESLKRMVSEFLTRLWKDGMLVGVTPEQAFRVRIDEQLNPPSLRELGQLVIEVRVAPTTPAEFIVFRVIQTPGRPLIDE